MLELSYILDGAGWATVQLSEGGGEVTMTASYLHDSLGELARAAIALREGRTTASVVFMNEPGEHLMLLERTDDGALMIEVRWFNHWASWGMHSEDQFEKVFEGRCRSEEFVAAVKRTLDEVLNAWGIDGYRQKWVEHSFPVTEHEMLSRV